MKKNNAITKREGRSQKAGRGGKPTHWISLVTVILLGTGVAIAIAIAFTPQEPLEDFPPDASRSMEPPLAAASHGNGNAPETATRVLFPAPDEKITVEDLTAELLAMAERLASEFQTSVDALHASAMTFAEFKQSKRAQEVWQQCIELKPKEAGPYVGLASILSQRGEDEQAVALLKNTLQSGKRSAELVAELASGLSKLGELEQADTVLEQGLKWFPESPDILTQRGTIDVQLQRFESAERAFRKAIECGGKPTSLQIMLSNVLTRQGKTEEASKLRSGPESTDAPISTNPSTGSTGSTGFDNLYLKTLRGLAVKLFSIGSRAAIENGNPTLAEQWLLRSVAIEPKDLTAYMELSAVYRRTNRFQQALSVQEKLLELQPDNVLNHINLASVASQLGRYDIAERTLSEATRVSPNVAFPFAELAKIHLGKRELSKAKQMITTARNLEPAKTEWHVMGAMIAESMGDAPGAVECLKRAFELSPNDESIAALLKAAQSAK